MFKRKNRHYTSPEDAFLHLYQQQTHQKSLAEQQEIDKAQRVAKLRDMPAAENESSSLWEGF